MKFITSERLKNEINQNIGDEVIFSKYELVMLIAKRAKQIAEKIAEEEPDMDLETIRMSKPITMAIDELEKDKVVIEKQKD